MAGSVRPSLLLLVAGLSLLVPRIVLADDAPKVDIVEMTDGSKLVGSVVELKRGTYVIIEVEGKQTKVPWSKVKNVLRDQPSPTSPPSAPPPPPAPPPSTPAPAVAAGPDVVALKSGDSISGTVVQQQPGEWVVIRTVDGLTHTLNWSVIKEVRVTCTPPAPAAASGSPAPTPGAPAASGTQETTVDTNKGIPSAVHYRSEVDCSKDPENDKCKETTKVDLSKGGLTAGFTHEEVTRVKEPKNYSINFSLDGTFEFGTTTKGGSSGFVSESAGIDIAVSFMVGTKLPGPEGGHFHGIAIQPTGNITG